MELRKAEQDLDKLCSEWNAIRRKRPCYEDDVTVDGNAVEQSESMCNSEVLPSWKDLMCRIVDDDIFPSVEQVVEEEREDETKTETAATSAMVESEPTNTIQAVEEPGYSEWGMLITGSAAAEKSAKENTVVQPIQQIPTKNNEKSVFRNVDADQAIDDEEGAPVENAPPPEILSQLESLRHNLELLRPKIDKFMTRLTERDPVTKKPRYGETAILRVKNIVRMFKALEIGVSFAFDDKGNGTTNIIQRMNSQIQHHDQQMQAKMHTIQTTQQLEAERMEQERLVAEQLAQEQRLKEEQAKQREAEELAKRAHEARLRRMEEEQRALDAEAQADRELMALVPVKGVDGIRMQIDRMRAYLKDDKKALDIALGSLYTLFDQIVRKPEEINFRRIRRDHPKFMEDIGRHVGGKEILIAAGFRLEKLDGVPCFFSKEPHIESDMDGWSKWFDGLKKTLEVIEEEMIK
ncbi:hypothetical protein HJC23_009410 [Cyclotella cryptica]|uniref:PUB domain-containing protein n=1 Tax=Cyclotella cryptica TaxID=29204 RepID=A0ABD3PY62_9STRA|eukprot:CCRYP_010596-RC/>CCRYP_010596-RC protein AED:0.38 eAED:0.38 QI:241/1/1/1/0.5/0.33/3/1609/463